MSRRQRPHAPSPRSRAAVWRENVESLVWAVAIALIIRTFIVAPFKIPSGSMRTTLMEGDRILVNKFLFHFRPPRRGEVIVFRYPDDVKRPFIKRLVGLGGDRVEIRDGRIVVNGALLDHPAIFQHTPYTNQGTYGQAGMVIQVPEGSYYVLGDNPSSSHDSRFWGFVPRRLVIGRAVCIFWPLHRLRAIH